MYSFGATFCLFPSHTRSLTLLCHHSDTHVCIQRTAHEDRLRSFGPRENSCAPSMPQPLKSPALLSESTINVLCFGLYLGLVFLSFHHLFSLSLALSSSRSLYLFLPHSPSFPLFVYLSIFVSVCRSRFLSFLTVVLSVACRDGYVYVAESSTNNLYFAAKEQ